MIANFEQMNTRRARAAGLRRTRQVLAFAAGLAIGLILAHAMLANATGMPEVLARAAMERGAW